MPRQTGAVWGPRRDSLPLLPSVLLRSWFLQKLGALLVARAGPAPRAGAVTEAMPAMILVIRRSLRPCLERALHAHNKHGHPLCYVGFCPYLFPFPSPFAAGGPAHTGSPSPLIKLIKRFMKIMY